MKDANRRLLVAVVRDHLKGVKKAVQTGSRINGISEVCESTYQ